MKSFRGGCKRRGPRKKGRGKIERRGKGRTRKVITPKKGKLIVASLKGQNERTVGPRVGEK